LYVRDFGAVGDGSTDDSLAIRKAVSAAVKAGENTKLIFESNKTYRIGKHQGRSLIELVGVNRLTIDGGNSTLLVHPHSGILRIDNCNKVKVGGFAVDYDPLPFTQGTITKIDSVKGFFDLELHKGYPIPPADDMLKAGFAPGWQWGSVIDPVRRHLKWGIRDHFFIDSVNKLSGRKYRISMAEPNIKNLVEISLGDRFFLPLAMTNKGEHIHGNNIEVFRSSDCTVANVTMHSARGEMNFLLINNTGRIMLRDNSIKFKPNTDRVCTTWRDGIHCKDNRIGPIIDNFYFEGMLDDSINISANTAMAEKVISPRKFLLMGIGAAIWPGNEILVFDPNIGEIIAQTKVVTVERVPQGNIVTLADPVKSVIAGKKRKEDIKSTHFYNLSYANKGFEIRNCTFKPQRRHAMLIRSCNGIIENNTIDGVGGAAVWMSNEMGIFYEGPFPKDNIIRNNIIRDTQLDAICIYTEKLGGSVNQTSDIQVIDNTITVLQGRKGIVAFDADNIHVENNRIYDQKGKDISSTGINIRK
jgi:hypothetical protein